MTVDIWQYHPFNKIKPVTVDGQEMIWFPKTYVKRTPVAGSKYQASECVILMSEFPLEGYHCHQAFIKDGKELKGFYLAQYPATVSADNKAQSVQLSDPVQGECRAYTDWLTYCTNRGVSWHMMNIYEYCFLWYCIIADLGQAYVNSNTWRWFQGIAVSSQYGLYKGIRYDNGNFALDRNPLGTVNEVTVNEQSDRFQQPQCDTFLYSTPTTGVISTSLTENNNGGYMFGRSAEVLWMWTYNDYQRTHLAKYVEEDEHAS